MKIIFPLKHSFENGLKVLFIVINLMNYTLILSIENSNLNIEDNLSSHFIDQAINNLPETNYNIIDVKVLTLSFVNKFYSTEFCLKKPGNHTKIFAIISECISESNARNSSFLIKESTTST